jgi:hypothetical protein
MLDDELDPTGLVALIEEEDDDAVGGATGELAR